mmetsp:Transcript_39045/g.112171  ORF Transcript_39045/g.112171 Transcript_39045/m.112171 type:complete len:287 (+) Transcript_39045:79-939(+)
MARIENIEKTLQRLGQIDLPPGWRAPDNYTSDHVVAKLIEFRENPANMRWSHVRRLMNDLVVQVFVERHNVSDEALAGKGLPSELKLGLEVAFDVHASDNLLAEMGTAKHQLYCPQATFSNRTRRRRRNQREAGVQSEETAVSDEFHTPHESGREGNPGSNLALEANIALEGMPRIVMQVKRTFIQFSDPKQLEDESNNRSGVLFNDRAGLLFVSLYAKVNEKQQQEQETPRVVAPMEEGPSASSVSEFQETVCGFDPPQLQMSWYTPQWWVCWPCNAVPVPVHTV